MTHYVCTGSCGAETNEPGFCQDEGCSMYGAPFVECNCVDGEHEEAAGGAAGNSDGELAQHNLDEFGDQVEL